MNRFAIPLLATLGLSLPMLAQEPKPSETGQTTDTKTQIEQAEQSESEKPWTLSGGVDYLTQYMYRGYNTVPSGLIIQPYVDFAYTVFSSDDFAITPHVGVWGDFTEKSGPHNPKHWAEGDITAGIGFDYKHWNLTIDYNYQGYPSKYAPGGEISEIQELQFLLTYDDSHCFDKVPLLASTNPHVSYIHEIKDLNDHDNNKYLEFGIEPTFEEFNVASLPVTISIPLTLGMSTDSYYTNDGGHNEVIGYWVAGIKATIPLPVPEKFGSWSVVLECDYLSLQAQSVRDANTGDRDDIIGRIGVEFEM
jgi:hypothetical protein